MAVAAREWTQNEAANIMLDRTISNQEPGASGSWHENWSIKELLKPSVLIVDDDPDLQSLVQATLRSKGVVVTAVYDAAEAIEQLEQEMFAAVVLDLGLPGLPGDQLLIRIREQYPDVPVVVLSGERDINRVVACMQAGALDYVSKPFEPLRLCTSVANAIEQGTLRRRVEVLSYERSSECGFGSLVGQSEPMRHAIALLTRSARSDVTVLVTGESGTGKEIAAKAIHSESARAEGPFLAVNCGAIPEGVIESELFGHERGAFTGANSARRGVFEEADGGTLFLDEIGELRADLQVRLLRVLQERQVQRVGASKPRDVDVRIIAATNRDLPARVESGEFRQDLYYRLAVFPVELPPLRERGDDVLVLAHAFLRRLALQHGRALQGWTRSAASALQAHTWPGNVRELQNVIERAVILEDADRLTLHSLPEELRELATEPERHVAAELPAAHNEPLVVMEASVPVSGVARPQTAEEVETFEVQEKRIFEAALVACDGNIREVSRRLSVGRATVYRKIEKYELDRDGPLGGNRGGESNS